MLLTIARRVVQLGMNANRALNRPANQAALAGVALTFGVKVLAGLVEDLVDQVATARTMHDLHAKWLGEDKERIRKLEQAVSDLATSHGGTYPSPEDLDPLQRADEEATPVFESTAAAAAAGTATTNPATTTVSFDGFSVVAGDGR